MVYTKKQRRSRKTGFRNTKSYLNAVNRNKYTGGKYAAKKKWSVREVLRLLGL